MTSPSPAKAPKVWGSITIGAHTFPADSDEGTVDGIPRVPSAQGLEPQKGAGKDGAQVKFTGAKLSTGEITIAFSDRIWSQTWTMLRELNPVFPENRGKRYKIDHPEFANRGVSEVCVEEIGPTEKYQGSNFAYSITIKVLQAPPPSQAAQVKGTKKADEKASDFSFNTVGGGVPGATNLSASVEAVDGGDTGFAGLNKPDDSP